MRVCHYLELEGPLRRSGISTAAEQQREAIDRLGSGDGESETPTNVELVTEPWGGPPWRLPLRLARGNEWFVDYDVAHCHTVGPGAVALAQHATRTGRPLVLHAHITSEDFAESFRGSTLAAKPLGRYLRWFYSQADLVCCPSEYTRRVLESYPIDAPIEPITNGVDVESLEGVESFREPYRETYDLEGMVVFAVGNVFERKGLTTFCRLARRTPYDFAWFGPYERGPHASSAVRKWTTNPPENVTFTGWIDDKRGAFGAGDVFLFPTKEENQGIAVLEAMACGKAVVLRDIPVFDEFYTHGEDCLKCSTFEDFREALERLDRDPDLRNRLGERARETASEHRLEVVGDRLCDVYEGLLEASG